MSGIRERLLRQIEPAVEAAGYELVELEFNPLARRLVVRLYIDRRDGAHVGLEDCELASRAVSTALESDDPIERGYDLEVSSPGFDRPLRKPEHFARFVGHEARIELPQPLDGRRRFRGRIVAVDPAAVQLEVDRKLWTIPLAGIGKARLVPSHES